MDRILAPKVHIETPSIINMAHFRFKPMVLILVLALLPGCFWGGDKDISTQPRAQIAPIGPGNPTFSPTPGLTPTPPPMGPTLSLSTTTLGFGVSGTLLFFELWNSGTGTLNNTIAVDQPWALLGAASGTSTGPTDKKIITVTVDRTGLGTGTHNALITVTPSAGTPQTIAVSLQIDLPAGAPAISVSRSSGVTPLAVDFDITSALVWNDLENLEFLWDFDDGHTAKGFLAGHVFELVEGDPTTVFHVHLSVFQNGVMLGQNTVSITVNPVSGTTTCVSPASAFSDCPTGAAHSTSLASAWSGITSGARLLLHRGESFALAGTLTTTVAGPVTIGAYGDVSLDKPLLTIAGGTSALSIRNPDWRILDLEISGDLTHTVPAVLINSDHFLSLRNDVHDVFAGFVSNGTGFGFANHNFIVDTTSTAAQNSSLLAGSNISVLDSQFSDEATDAPALLFPGAKQVLLSGNDFSVRLSDFTLQLRSDEGSSGRDSVQNLYATGNTFAGGVNVQPKADQRTEFVQNISFEDNTFQLADETTSREFGISFNAANATIRNNVFFNHRKAISIETVHDHDASSTVSVLGNTVYNPIDHLHDHYLVKIDSDSKNVRVHNNVIDAVGTGTATKVIVGDAILFEASHNIGYLRNVPGECLDASGNKGSPYCPVSPLFQSTSPASGSFLRPAAGSSLIDSGITVDGFFDDFTGAARSNPPDIGAYEGP